MAALIFAGATPACVPQTLYEQSLNEQATLERELARAKRRSAELELGIRNLENERAELIERNEALRLDEAALRERNDGERARAAALEARNAQLSETLTIRDEELEARSAEIAAMRSTYDTLVADLQSEVAQGQVEVERLKGGLKVKLAQAVLFDSGSASLTGVGREVITRVARRLVKGDTLVEVQGHSDNRAIRASSRTRYPSNWELAGARAAAVVRVLQEGGVASARMRAVSYADTQPVADNSTASGRADNRRIEILLRPAASEPGRAEAPAASALDNAAEPGPTENAATAQQQDDAPLQEEVAPLQEDAAPALDGAESMQQDAVPEAAIPQQQQDDAPSQAAP